MASCSRCMQTASLMEDGVCFSALQSTRPTMAESHVDRIASPPVPPLDLESLPMSPFGRPPGQGPVPKIDGHNAPRPPTDGKPTGVSPLQQSRGAYASAGHRGSSAPGTRLEKRHHDRAPFQRQDHLAPPRHHPLPSQNNTRQKKTLADRGISMQGAVQAVLKLQGETPSGNAPSYGITPGAHKHMHNIFRSLQEDLEPSPDQEPYAYTV